MMSFLTHLTPTTLWLTVSLILVGTLNGVVLSSGESSDTKCVIHSSSPSRFLIELFGSSSSTSCPRQHSQIRKVQLTCSLEEFYSKLWQIKESDEICAATEKSKMWISPEVLIRKREIASQKRALKLQRRILQHERRAYNRKRRVFEQTSQLYEAQSIEYETARRLYLNTRKTYESKRREYEKSSRTLEGHRDKREKDTKEILHEITEELSEITDELQGIMDDLRILSSEMGSLFGKSNLDPETRSKTEFAYDNGKDKQNEIAQEKYESKIMMESEQQPQILEMNRKNHDKSAAMLRQQIAAMIHQQQRASVRNETDDTNEDDDDDAELEVVNFAIL